MIEETLAHIASREDELFTPMSNLHGFIKRLTQAAAEDLVEVGLERESILTDGLNDVVGRYAPTTAFTDVVVLNDEGLPQLMVEIKASLSSLSKNMRNRLDEIIASATNIARTFDTPERAPFKPCIALIFVVAWTDTSSTQPRPLRASDVTARPSSPIETLGSAFLRMLEDRLLDAVCLLAVDRVGKKVLEPYENLSFEAFTREIQNCTAPDAPQRFDGLFRAVDVGRAFGLGGDVEGIVTGLTSTSVGLSAAEGAIISRRRETVAELQRLAQSPDANETKMHRAIGSNYWLFGGQYVGVADRRTLMPLDQYDIPLLCADGSLEIIELKGPEVDIVARHRNHLIVTDDVHRAVSQCLNYLRSLDELGPALATQYRNELGIDFDLRRAKGTVVVGHPGRQSKSGASRSQVDQTIRSYNSHLSRLTVLTYADLLDSAERALRFAAG